VAGAAHQARVLGLGLEQVAQAGLDLVHNVEERRVHVTQQRQRLRCARARSLVSAFPARPLPLIVQPKAACAAERYASLLQTRRVSLLRAALGVHGVHASNAAWLCLAAGLPTDLQARAGWHSQDRAP
jgi:hypothetical protein